MPDTYIRRKRRAGPHKNKTKKQIRQQTIALFIGVSLILLMLLAAWWVTRSESGVMYDTRYQVVGAPSIDADLIGRVLDAYDSPARGNAQVLYDLGVKYKIDPVYALAFFMQESRFGTTGVARITYSLGNIRTTPGYADYDGYRKYKSWVEGFEDWYKLIKVQYVDRWKLLTIDQIIPVYAPSSDHNDVDAYIQSVKHAIDAWHQGQVRVYSKERNRAAQRTARLDESPGSVSRLPTA